MRAEFDMDEPITRRRLRRIFCRSGRYITGAEAAAIALFLAALVDHRAMESAVRLAEGAPPLR